MFHNSYSILFGWFLSFLRQGLCSSDSPETHSVEQVDLEFRDLPTYLCLQNARVKERCVPPPPPGFIIHILLRGILGLS